MPENIYCNTISRPNSKSASKDRDKRDGIFILVPLSVLVFLSLVGNGVLAYLIHSNATEELLGCEPVTNCSGSDDEHRAHMEDRAPAHHCPNKNLPEKWVQKKGRFYVFSTDKTNWNRSRERCQALGGDLVIINNREEQIFLAKEIHNIKGHPRYWIGLTDSHTEGEWLWVDNSRLDDNLRLWTKPPDDYKGDNPLGEDCVVLNGQVAEAHWGDVSCLRDETRVCEIACSE